MGNWPTFSSLILALAPMNKHWVGPDLDENHNIQLASTSLCNEENKDATITKLTCQAVFLC